MAPIDTSKRRAQLHAIARNYVTERLGKKNFDAIPYDEDVSLRAPLCPGGSAVPLWRKERLREIWWAPLPKLVGAVQVLDTFVNDDLTVVTVEFHCSIVEPACTLRMVDCFKVNAEDKITEQESFFDPRDVTHPGWQTG